METDTRWVKTQGWHQGDWFGRSMCRLGAHKWYERPTWQHIRERTCVRCGKRQVYSLATYEWREAPDAR